MNLENKELRTQKGKISATELFADSLLHAGDLLRHTLVHAGSAIKPKSFLTTSGLQAELIDVGILCVRSQRTNSPPNKIVLSAGIHGNETGPVEMLNTIIQKVFAGECKLQEDVLFVMGSPEALVTGTRYVETDLNREFLKERSQADKLESRRAARIEEVVCRFMEESMTTGIHLDLHTTNKQSKYQHFAIAQNINYGFQDSKLYRVLQNAQLSAVVVKKQRSNVFSYFSAAKCGAQAATVELGVASQLGTNNLADYVAVQEAITDLLSGTDCSAEQGAIKLFGVSGAVTVKTDQFQLQVPKEYLNFREFRPGTVYAYDGTEPIVLEQGANIILFPDNEPKKAAVAVTLLHEL